jgi:hypothetical protein
MARWRRRGRLDDEIQNRHQEAWERYLEAERRELELRREGHLAKLLGVPLPNESAAELKRYAREDEERAEQGLVQLRRGDRVWWKHIDELTEDDRPARAEAERVLTRWMMDRQSRRPPPLGGSW